MFQNDVGTRKESCEWCNNGTNDHTWPENGRKINHSLNAFKLSISNFNHSECKKPEEIPTMLKLKKQ
jgi:hypothetical protein